MRDAFNRVRFTAFFILLSAAIQGCSREPAAPAQQETAAIHAVLTQVANAFNGGDLDAAMTHFTEDAVISGQGEPDVVGAPAIRAMYAAALAQVRMTVTFHTEEVRTAGDLAFERGTYTVDLADKTSGNAIGRMDNRHVHVLRKGEDGQWRTWRMMVNSSRGGPPAPLPAAER